MLLPRFSCGHVLYAASCVTSSHHIVASQGSPAYQRLLERLSLLARAHGPLLPASPPPLLSVCVAPTLPFPPRASAGVELDTTKGLLWVGVDSGDAPLDSPEALHEALRDAAPQAARAAAAKQREADTTARLQRQVERALRLRRLVREVPVDRFSAACARLVSHAPQLMPLLESTSVVISEGFGVASDGAFVRIPWDFEV